jgi:hypothetical protein
MLNAIETKAAEDALVYPSSELPRDERVAAKKAYNEELAAIVAQFRAYLADTYLSGFNTAVQDAVWNKVREDGYGYENMEIAYDELADILKLV